MSTSSTATVLYRPYQRGTGHPLGLFEARALNTGNGSGGYNTVEAVTKTSHARQWLYVVRTVSAWVVTPAANRLLELRQGAGYFSTVQVCMAQESILADTVNQGGLTLSRPWVWIGPQHTEDPKMIAVFTANINGEALGLFVQGEYWDQDDPQVSLAL